MEIAAYLSQHIRPVGTQITSLYWSVSESALREITERVSTDVIALVNEMRAGMDTAQKIPAAELATQAVNVVVKGDNNRIITGGIASHAKSSNG